MGTHEDVSGTFYAKEFMRVLRLNSYDREDPISEWKLLDLMEESDEMRRCICSKDIHNLYYIQNRVDKKILTIGSDCALRWMECRMHCLRCKNEMGNVMKRRARGDYFCRSCKKYLEKKGQCWFTMKGKYLGKRWAEVKEDEEYVNFLANLDDPHPFIINFLRYCENFYEFSEAE